MKDNIIDSAFEIIATSGYDNLTMDNLAKMVNIKKGSLYYYFSSKENLIDNLYLYISTYIKQFTFKVSFAQSGTEVLTSCFNFWKKLYIEELYIYLGLIEQRKNIDKRAEDIDKHISLMINAQSSAIIENILLKHDVHNKNVDILSLIFSSSAFTILNSDHSEDMEASFIKEFYNILIS